MSDVVKFILDEGGTDREIALHINRVFFLVGLPWPSNVILEKVAA